MEEGTFIYVIPIPFIEASVATIQGEYLIVNRPYNSGATPHIVFNSLMHEGHINRRRFILDRPNAYTALNIDNAGRRTRAAHVHRPTMCCSCSPVMQPALTSC